MKTDLASYPVVVEIPVAWGEMDAFGHLNHAVYFRYMETARILYFERLGIPEFLGRDTLGPILGAISCRYRAPLTYPDRVSVGVKVTRVEEDRFVMAYVIFTRENRPLSAFDVHAKAWVPSPEGERLFGVPVELLAGSRELHGPDDASWCRRPTTPAPPLADENADRLSFG